MKKSALQAGEEPSCPFYRELEYIFNPAEVPSPPVFQKMHMEIGEWAGKTTTFSFINKVSW